MRRTKVVDATSARTERDTLKKRIENIEAELKAAKERFEEVDASIPPEPFEIEVQFSTTKGQSSAFAIEAGTNNRFEIVISHFGWRLFKKYEDTKRVKITFTPIT